MRGFRGVGPVAILCRTVRLSINSLFLRGQTENRLSCRVPRQANKNSDILAALRDEWKLYLDGSGLSGYFQRNKISLTFTIRKNLCRIYLTPIDTNKNRHSGLIYNPLCLCFFSPDIFIGRVCVWSFRATFYIRGRTPLRQRSCS